MSLSTPSWQSISADFVPDGGLRDIYVFDANEAVWSRFLTALRETDYTCSYFHGSDRMSSWIERFEHAAELREVNPVLLKIMVGPIQVNCHFFTPDEIELDIDPREIMNESRYEQLLGFLRWLTTAVDKRASLTYENSEELKILEVAPNGDITTGCS